jgi:acetate kinase
MLQTILTMNGGSSSLKFSVATASHPPRRIQSGSIASIGTEHAVLTIDRQSGDPSVGPVSARDHVTAAQCVLDRLESEGALRSVAAVGHRLVHGGRSSERSRRVTPALLAELRSLAPLDPDHLPAELAIIEATARLAPSIPQIACFDTTFHRTMPRVARLLPLPRRYFAAGLERYGFHGISYTFLLEELARIAGPAAATGRVILAHLGAGASLAAVRDGRSVDTTMGFTPTSGVMMATRSGDLDPGALVWLLRTDRLGVDALDDLLNRRSGLLGVSDTTADMRELLARESSDPRAADAVALFCHQARKAIGALAATIGGVETLVFSGGIGATSAIIRARIAEGLEHLGIELDPARNTANAAVISIDGARTVVRRMVTDEESILARDALAILESPNDEDR